MGSGALKLRLFQEGDEAPILRILNEGSGLGCSLDEWAWLFPPEEDGRAIVVGKSGSRSTVVWNPWIDKSKRMADFGDDEWPRMVCIETANVADNAVNLAPGAKATMSATLKIESSLDSATLN